MSHALYMDVHVPVAVTIALLRHGIDVLTAQDDGTRQAEDEDLLSRATQLGRILVTQDADLLAIAAAWQNQGREFVGLIYCHQLSIGIGGIIDDLELIARCAAEHEVNNCVIYLPLR